MVPRQKAGPAEMLATLASRVNPPPLPLAEQFPLEPGKAGHHRQHESAGGRCGVDAEVEDAQVNATLKQIVCQKQNVRGGAAETADLRDGQYIAWLQRGDYLVKDGTFGDARRTLDHDSGRTSPLEGIDLPILGLVGGRDAGIPDDYGGCLIGHPTSVFCHPPFVTNKEQVRSRFVNSVRRYTLCRHPIADAVPHCLLQSGEMW